ncbi:MAG: UDP-N-acetylglucosamine--LPS N-acetylglucosamine transferase [Phycisphaerales bacterium]
MRTDRQRVKPTRILAVASGGGHWVQLLRLRPAFADAAVTYVTVNEAYRSDVATDLAERGARFAVIDDATRWDKLGLAKMAARLLWIVLRTRPHVVVSTGAAPGYFAIRFARLFGARTIWLDSVANVERLSMTGELVGRHADLWLTQWPHLAKPDGPRCEGAVL